MSDISAEAWKEAQQELAQLCQTYKNGWRSKRMDPDLFEFLRIGREGNVPWPALHRLCQEKRLTNLQGWESLRLAYNKETQERAFIAHTATEAEQMGFSKGYQLD